MKAQARTMKNGKLVRLSDAELRTKVKALIREGYVTRASVTLRLREIGLGTNAKRVDAAFAAVNTKRPTRKAA